MESSTQGESMRLRSLLTIPLLSLLLLPLAAFGAGSPTPLQARRDALSRLLAEQWEYNLSTNPEFASILGDKRWNDKLSDISDKALEADLAKSKDYLRRYEAIDTTGFPEQEALNKALSVRDLRERIEGFRFKGWLMPVNQISGIHLQGPQLASFLSFTTSKDYEDLITRYRGLPGLFDQTMQHMRQGMAAGLMPPRFLLQKVVAQVEGVAVGKPEDSPFAEPLSRFPKDMPAAEQARLRSKMLAAIRDDVLPAYARFGKLVKEEYVPKGRTEVGLWSLPDGEARYAYQVKVSTTTDMTPEQIHQIGLQEVERIEGEMRKVAEKLGYADLGTLNAAIGKNPDLHPHSRQQIIDLYKQHIDAMYTKLPQLFGRLPKAKVEVLQTEAFREKEASGAEYNQPAADGSRPGRVMVNTFEPEKRTTLNMESTAYHEGVPGHHMQVTIAQELPTLPPFRQQGNYTAFAEGWALYSERLGKEVGFYQDPYSDYGRLQDEMLRAIRLVVDTGLHAKRWTREQVVRFFHDHSAIDEVDVQSETDRYIVWPGQALAYKVGQMKISELREKAHQALGDRFDIRAFHDEVLGAGALPMDVLAARIDAWIASPR
jgi:uncharacterized protein (DUF885 family)